MEKKCMYCKREFHKPIYVSRSVWKSRKFCCHKCGHEYEKQESKIKAMLEPRKCIVCWETFYRNTETTSLVQWSKQKHCSKKCNTVSFGRAWTAYNKSKAISMPDTKECVICWKEYGKNWRRWPKMWWSAVTCSRECAVVYRAKQPYKESRRFNQMKSWKWWYNRKMIVFARDNFMCQMCGYSDPMIMQVDHKIERSIDPTLKNALNNLQTLCPNCHARKTNVMKSQSDVPWTHLEILPRVKLLQDNPDYLKHLLDLN